MKMQTCEWGLLGKDVVKYCFLKVRHGKTLVFEIWGIFK